MNPTVIVQLGLAHPVAFTAAAALTALAALALIPVLGIRALAGWAREQQRHTWNPGDRETVTVPLRLPRVGYLSREEWAAQTWCDQTTARDLDRLAMVEHVVLHRLNVVVENAVRQLLDPHDRAWIRIETGEFQLVGVA